MFLIRKPWSWRYHRTFRSSVLSPGEPSSEDFTRLFNQLFSRLRVICRVNGIDEVSFRLCFERISCFLVDFELSFSLLVSFESHSNRGLLVFKMFTLRQ